MTTQEPDALPAVIETAPADLVAYAGKAAAATRAIVEQTAQQIGPKRYVRVEGWQAIALAHGCVTSSRAVQRTEGGITAIGEVRRRDTGTVVAEAEGFVGDDESMWAHRPEFARRAMAQTRAISRACRAAFAHVIVMMNANLETTPAEEMEGAVEVAPRRPTAPKPNQHVTERDMTTVATPAATWPVSDPKPKKPASEWTVGVLEKVSVRDGESGGKPWTKFGAFILGEWYGTFCAPLGAAMQECEGVCVKLGWFPDGKYRTAVYIEPWSEASEDAVPEPPPLPPELEDPRLL
jgi:hypothetical protein